MTDPTPIPRVDPARAYAWVRHLRSGGVRSWREFAEAPELPDQPGQTDQTDLAAQGPLPCAQALELLRRLNLAAQRAASVPGGGASAGEPGERTDPSPALVDLVLASVPPGRGLPPLGLEGVADGADGGPVADPGALGGPELLRIAGAVLAAATQRATPETSWREQAVTGRSRHRQPRQHGQFRVIGDPMLCADWRHQLRSRGLTPGDVHADVWLLMPDLARALRDVWEWRVMTGHPATWQWFSRRWRRTDELPPRLRIHDEVTAWANRRRVRMVHVVLADPIDVPGLGHPDPDVPGLPRLSWTGLELLAAINLRLRGSVDPAQHHRLIETVLLPALSAEPDLRRTEADVALDPETHDWLVDHAARLSAELSVSGYGEHLRNPVVVHGHPAKLSPGSSSRGELEPPTTAELVEAAERVLCRLGRTLPAEGVR